MSNVSPREVLKEVAAAMPPDYRDAVIIIGSLAAGYYYFGDDPDQVVQTKDVDCMLSPHIKAVPAGKVVAEGLFNAGWKMRSDPKWGKPGNADTPAEDLPLVRMQPPGGDEWFIELMMSPPTTAGAADDVRPDPNNPAKHYVRLKTDQGDFSLCSFGYLSLVEYQPIGTEFGIRIARPDMMALANLLHHPVIGPELMSGMIRDRVIKRSNKDLGRVVALAWLAMQKSSEALLIWPPAWADALHEQFNDEWKSLASRAGNGLRQLLDSPNDLDEAQHSCAAGLLTGRNLNRRQFELAAERLLQDAIEPLEAMAKL
jgi:hypothetical protein